MIYETLYLQKKWFSEATPTNPKKATATLTFTGIPIVAQTVTIGTEIYELVAAAIDIADPANIPVVLGSTLSADNAVTKLAEAISANSSLVDAVGSTTADTVLLVYNEIGTEGNDVAIETDFTNASFGVEVTTLSGGQFGTPCISKNVIVYASPYYYFCDAEGGETTVSWKRFTPATY